ncbi:MAG: hypothetical protein IJK07_04575 [Bacteroidales bacterium]|nr:hypothetical protein [Bacteroidales bacterium]
MKKSFKFAAIAVAAIALMTACNNAPEAADTTAVDTPEVIDTPIVDTPVVDTTVVEEAPAPAAKKPAKKKNNTPAVTKEKTEGGRTIGKINTTEEKTTVKEEAIKTGKLSRN